MGVAADHFFIDSVDNVFNGETPFLGSDLSVHNHLQQDISQLFTQVSVVLFINRLQDFAGFLYQTLFQAFMSLFSVPGTALFTA